MEILQVTIVCPSHVTIVRETCKLIVKLKFHEHLSWMSIINYACKWRVSWIQQKRHAFFHLTVNTTLSRVDIKDVRIKTEELTFFYILENIIKKKH